MTELSVHFAENDHRLLQERLGAFLRRRTADTKSCARAIGCDPRSAENYRAGRYWPNARHWLGIVHTFQRDVTEAVFHPDAAAARLQQEVQDLEQQLATRRAALCDVAGGQARLAQGHPPTTDRPAG